MAKLLFVEDDLELAYLVIAVLEHERFKVEHSANGIDGLELALCSAFSLILLDIDLPGKSGMEVCREFRQSDSTTPILMLTGRGSITDKTTGLDFGADDYLVKPFSNQELLARIRALLRRAAGAQSNVVEFGGLQLNLVKQCILKENAELDLNPREFALLEFFIRHPEQVFSIDTLLNNVWRSDKEQSPNALRMCITRLRKVIDAPDAENSLIRTIHRVGYKLTNEVLS
jgi:DNA-binding response OmpR family regulator